MWTILACIVGAGALGGLVNSLLTDGGLKLASKDPQIGVLRIGWLGNVILGGFAAALSWGLYGPLKDGVLLGPHQSGEVSPNLTVTVLIGAALAGAGGSRIITSEVQKRLMASAAANAASGPRDPNLANLIRTTQPEQAALAAQKSADLAGDAPVAAGE